VQGTTLCIHSVVVAAELRRRGLGGTMLKAYVQQVAEHSPVRTILLMCKKPLIPFYSDAGFALVGQSDVVHGADPWFEMKCVTKPSE
jgi:predicted GNAT family N-acyltransferase